MNPAQEPLEMSKQLMDQLHALIQRNQDEGEEGEAIREQMDGLWCMLTEEQQTEIRQYSAELYKRAEQSSAVRMVGTSSNRLLKTLHTLEELTKTHPTIPILVIPGNMAEGFNEALASFAHPRTIAEETADQLTELLKRLPESIPFLAPESTFADRQDREARRIRAREAAKELERQKKIQAYGQAWVEEQDGMDRQLSKNRKAAKAAKKARKQNRRK